MKNDLFDTRPKVKPHPLNVLPPNPEEVETKNAVKSGRFPSWLHRKMPQGNMLWQTGAIVRDRKLPTVCEEAKCPNLLDCWSRKTATFLVMGKECTRACGFCDIDFNKEPKPPESDEPDRIADSVKDLGLKHVVITMVARDDLPDGGASHIIAITDAIREKNKNVTIELLTADFHGNHSSWESVLKARPEIFNYNIETVRALTPRVRHKATYERTLEFLHFLHTNRHPQMWVKSGLMVGLGETKEQVFETLHDLKQAGCDIVTMGQYLQANRHKLRVKAFIPPSQFEEYAKYGKQLGIKEIYAGPFVRSSYNAEALFQKLQG